MTPRLPPLDLGSGSVQGVWPYTLEVQKLMTRLKKYTKNRPLSWWAEALGLLLAGVLFAIAIGVLILNSLAFGSPEMAFPELEHTALINGASPWVEKYLPTALLFAVILAMWKRLGNMRDNDLKHLHTELLGMRGDIKECSKKVDRHVEWHLWAATGGQPPPERS